MTSSYDYDAQQWVDDDGALARAQELEDAKLVLSADGRDYCALIGTDYELALAAARRIQETHNGSQYEP